MESIEIEQLVDNFVVPDHWSEDNHVTWGIVRRLIQVMEEKRWALTRRLTEVLNLLKPNFDFTLPPISNIRKKLKNARDDELVVWLEPQDPEYIGPFCEEAGITRSMVLNRRPSWNKVLTNGIVLELRLLTIMSNFTRKSICQWILSVTEMNMSQATLLYHLKNLFKLKIELSRSNKVVELGTLLHLDFVERVETSRIIVTKTENDDPNMLNEEVKALEEELKTLKEELKALNTLKEELKALNTLKEGAKARQAPIETSGIIVTRAKNDPNMLREEIKALKEELKELKEELKALKEESKARQAPIIVQDKEQPLEKISVDEHNYYKDIRKDKSGENYETLLGKYNALKTAFERHTKSKNNKTFQRKYEELKADCARQQKHITLLTVLRKQAVVRKSGRVITVVHPHFETGRETQIQDTVRETQSQDTGRETQSQDKVETLLGEKAALKKTLKNCKSVIRRQKISIETLKANLQQSRHQQHIVNEQMETIDSLKKQLQEVQKSNMLANFDLQNSINIQNGQIRKLSQANTEMKITIVKHDRQIRELRDLNSSLLEDRYKLKLKNGSSYIPSVKNVVAELRSYGVSARNVSPAIQGVIKGLLEVEVPIESLPSEVTVQKMISQSKKEKRLHEDTKETPITSGTDMCHASGDVEELSRPSPEKKKRKT